MKQIIGKIKVISKGNYSLEEYCKLVLGQKNIVTCDPYSTFTDKFFNESKEIFGYEMINVNGEIYQVVANDDYSNKEYISFVPASDPGYFIYYTNIDDNSNVNDIIKEGILDMFKNMQNRRPNKNKKKNPISKLCFYQITEHPELGYFKTKEEAQQKLDEIKLNEKE